MSAQYSLPPDQRNKRQYYVEMWKGMLQQLLGWSENQAMRWISQYEPLLDDPESLVYHQPPQYWVAPAMIPDEIKHRLSPLEAISLRNRVLAVFDDSNHYWFPPDTDWRVYKDRISGILLEFRE